MFTPTFFKTTGVVCFALIAVTACRPDEQGRPLRYEQGVMKQMNPSENLSDTELADLRQRSVYQGGVTISHSVGGGTTEPGSDVRPPSDANKALLERGKLQGSGN